MSDIAIGLLAYLVISIVAAKLFYKAYMASETYKDKDEGFKFSASCIGGVTWPFWILFRFVTGHW